MNQPKLNIIVAIDKKGGIGAKNRLLWHIPAELKRFKEITTGHPIIMGMNTYYSIGKPLPNRTNIVISHEEDFRAEGCIVVHSLEEAIEEAKKVDKDKIFIIGGGFVFKQALPIVDKLYITKVEGDYEADVFFPDYSDFKKVVYKSEILSDNGYEFQFLELER